MKAFLHCGRRRLSTFTGRFSQHVTGGEGGSGLSEYDSAISAFLGRRGDPLPAAEAAAEKGVLMAACLGSAAILSGCGGGSGSPAEDSERLRRFTARLRPSSALTPSESLHSRGAIAWSSGRLRRAAALYEGALLHVPTDVLALRCLHELYGALGDSSNLLGCVARVLPAWNPAVPGFASVLAMQACAYAENGMHRECEETAGRALEADIYEAWAVRAIVASMMSEGRYRDAQRALRELRASWEGADQASVHLSWYGELAHLEMGRYDLCLQEHEFVRAAPFSAGGDAVKHGAVRHALLDAADTASLLWRLRLVGHARDESESTRHRTRWAAVAAAFEPWAGADHTQLTPWLRVHAVMAFAGAGRQDLLDRSVSAAEVALALPPMPAASESSEEWGRTSPSATLFSLPAPGGAELGGNTVEDDDAYKEQGHGFARAMTAHMALPLCRALRDFASGDHAGCAHTLRGHRNHVRALGGGATLVQLDVFEQTLVCSLLAAAGVDHGGGEIGGPVVNPSNAEVLLQARAVLAERLLRVSSSPQSWVWNAKLLAALGDEHTAQDCMVRAHDLGRGQGGFQTH